METKRMTLSQFRAKVIATGSHFFDRDTLKFFGQTMKDFSLKGPVKSMYHGEEINTYELHVRKSPYAPKDTGTKVYYFNADTFEYLYCKFNGKHI